MSTPNWNALLPKIATIEAMSAGELEAAAEAVDTHGMAIGFEIAAIGNLLACTAANDETGLCKEAATNIGWLLQLLGTLSAKLADNATAINGRRRREVNQ